MFVRIVKNSSLSTHVSYVTQLSLLTLESNSRLLPNLSNMPRKSLDLKELCESFESKFKFLSHLTHPSHSNYSTFRIFTEKKNNIDKNEK